MDNTSKTYCKYFFNHVALYNGMNAVPCCRYDSRLATAPTVTRGKPFTTFTEAIYSDNWNELRRKVLNGERENGCWKCYEDEERGNKSLRNMANEMGQQEIFDEIKIEYLEVNLGNYCNLACNICSSHNSDKWYEDDLALAKYPELGRASTISIADYKENGITDIELNLDDYKDVNLIKFVGGEPMIHPKFMPMLDFLIKHGLHEQMQIQVFTNASWVPKKRIIERLSQFKNVTISLSIDGVKEVNDYSRYPSKWDIVEESARKWVAMGRDIECVNVRIEPTLSIYNALTIVDLIKWWIEISMEVRDKPFHEAIYNDYLEDINIILNSIHEPTYLSSNILPAKSIPNERLNEYIVDMKSMYWIEENDQAKNMVKSLRSILTEVKAHINADADPKNLKSFIKFSGTLDIRRNNAIKSQLPELWDIITTG